MALFEEKLPRNLELHTSDFDNQSVTGTPDTNDSIGKTPEENYNLINQAIENGAKSIEDIVKETGINRRKLNKLAFRGNIILPGRDYRTKEDILNGIRLATEQGQTAETISEFVGFTRKTVVDYASKAGIRLHGVNYKSSEINLETEVKTTRKTHRKTVEKVIAIREAYLIGAYTVEMVMETTRLSNWAVKEYSPYAGINFSIRKREKGDRVNGVRQAIANGADTVYAIRDQVGLAIGTINKYGLENNIRLPGRDYRTREEKIAEIQQAKDNGYTSLDELAIQSHLSESLTYTLIKERKINIPGISLPVRPGVKRRPGVDRLIEKGATLQEMVNEFGQTRETMRLYVSSSGQYNAWMENKQQAKLLAKQG